MKTVLGPWTWQIDDEGSGLWAPPAAGAAIDLRSLSEQSTPGRTQGERAGVGLFIIDDSASLDSAFELLGTGALDEIPANQRLRDLFPHRAGFIPTGTTVAELLWEALTVGSCPDGSEFARPLMPGSRRRLELHCGGHCRSEPFAWGMHPHTNVVRDVIREDIRAAFNAAHRGELKDDIHHCRCLDFLCARYGVPWQELVPQELVNEIPGRVPHDTTYLEDFVRPDGTMIGNQLTWTEVVGDWRTIGNQASVLLTGGSTANASARAEHDLSASDMLAQAIISGTGGVAAGGCSVRHHAADDTRYSSTMRTNISNILKVQSGVHSSLTSGGGWINGDLLGIVASGSTLVAQRNGVSVLTTTDTAITGHLRAGICGKESSTRISSFRISDVLQGVPAVYFRRRRAHC